MSDQPPDAFLQRLRRYRQEHLVRTYDELPPARQQALIEQIEAIDIDQMARLLAGESEQGESIENRARRARPPREMVRLPQTDQERAEWKQAESRGEELLGAGRVASVVVAGGQGTRLGFDHPKGMYPIGPVSDRPLFQVLAEQVLARSRRAGAAIPCLVMTSDATHEETVSFFQERGYFGLPVDDVYFFRQGNMPAADAQSGRLLLADKDRVATSPDGHGGILQALRRAGLIDELRRRGVELLYYHQVDNPTAIVCDPVFLGFHVLRGSEMSTKVVAKRSPEEKMGVVVEVDGRTQVIEYSDLPGDVAEKRDEEGRLVHWAGSTAIHVFDLGFLERLTEQGITLPFHRAHKKVAYVDESGHRVEPENPNAWKFERFIFDALPHARGALVLEADRPREFNPVKKAEGDDSPETARAALSELGRRWLREAGARVTDGIPVEISPCVALGPDALRDRIEPGTEFHEPVCLQ